jgi:hypothetical protein
MVGEQSVVSGQLSAISRNAVELARIIFMSVILSAAKDLRCLARQPRFFAALEMTG